MNRNQRKTVKTTKRNSPAEKLKGNHYNDNIEEVLPPKGRRNPFTSDRPVANRCCYVSPDYKDVEQATEYTGVDDQFQNLILQQYDFDPTIPEKILQLKELRKVLCGGQEKVENCSQYVRPRRASYIEIADGSQWQSIDNTDEIDEYFSAEKDYSYNDGLPKDKIYISEVPKIKVIVEKFSKLKKNNVEVRKLEEKIVCIEYDVFDEKDDVDDYSKTPIQKMRAYFSIKPASEENEDNTITKLPSTVKRNFNISDGDLGKLNEKEIEIIDSEIADNKPYLDDLKKVLLRNQAFDARKKKSYLDLMALYKMAKNEILSDECNTNLLSNAGLQEIKDLLAKESPNSKHGINRRTIKTDKNNSKNGQKKSQSIFDELMKSYDYK